MTLGLIVGGLLIVGIFIARMIRAGADRETAKAATEALQDVANANRPVSMPERELLQSKYRRD